MGLGECDDDGKKISDRLYLLSTNFGKWPALVFPSSKLLMKNVSGSNNFAVKSVKLKVFGELKRKGENTPEMYKCPVSLLLGRCPDGFTKFIDEGEDMHDFYSEYFELLTTSDEKLKRALEIAGDLLEEDDDSCESFANTNLKESCLAIEPQVSVKKASFAKEVISSPQRGEKKDGNKAHDHTFREFSIHKESHTHKECPRQSQRLKEDTLNEKREETVKRRKTRQSSPSDVRQDRGAQIEAHHQEHPNTFDDIRSQCSENRSISTDISRIREEDEWIIVWRKLKEIGWTWKHALTDRIYFKKDNKELMGVEGKDYFRSEKAFKKFIMTKYDWNGEVLSPPSEGRSTKRKSAVAPLTTTSAKKRSTTGSKNTTSDKRESAAASSNSTEVVTDTLSKKRGRNLIVKNDLSTSKRSAVKTKNNKVVSPPSPLSPSRETKEEQRFDACTPSPDARSTYGSLPVFENVTQSYQKKKTLFPDSTQSITSSITSFVDQEEFVLDDGNSDGLSMSSTDQKTNEEYWSILKQELNFGEVNDFYVLPNTLRNEIQEGKNAFRSIRDLQEYLVRYKIPCERPQKLTDENYETLVQWLSYTFVPNPEIAYQNPSYEKKNFAPHSLLIQQGFRYSPERGLLPSMYIIPDSKPPLKENDVAEFLNLAGVHWIARDRRSIQEWICRNGVPGPESDAKENLLAWASSYAPLEIFPDLVSTSRGSRSGRKRKQTSAEKSVSSKVGNIESIDKPEDERLERVAPDKCKSQERTERKSCDEPHDPVEICEFTEIWRILVCLGFKYSKDQFILPRINQDESPACFRSTNALRRHLAQSKIPMIPSKVSKLSSNDEKKLRLWLAYTNVPENPGARYPLKDSEAWKLLEKSGFKCIKGHYVLPGKKLFGHAEKNFATRGLDWFEKLSEIQEWCCRNGISSAEYTDDEYNRLCLWATCCATFDIFQDDVDDESTLRSLRKGRCTPKKLALSPCKNKSPKHQTSQKMISAKFSSEDCDSNRVSICTDDNETKKASDDYQQDDYNPSEALNLNDSQDKDDQRKYDNKENQKVEPLSWKNRSTNTLDDFESMFEPEEIVEDEKMFQNLDGMKKEALDFNQCLKRLDLSLDASNTKAIVGREEMVHASKFFRNALASWGHSNSSEFVGFRKMLHISGPPGSGKSTTMRGCIKEIKGYFSSLKQEDNGDNGSPIFISVNCSVLRSRSANSMVSYFLNSIASAMGLRNDTTLDKIESNLIVSHKSQKLRGIFMILDEVDLLPQNTTCLKIFSGWSLSAQHLFTMVCVSNTVNIRSDFFENQENVEKIVFPPYGQEDLIKIVQKRVGKQCFEKSALDLASRKVSRGSGDAREMLKLASNSIDQYLIHMKTGGAIKDDEPNTISLRYMMKAIRGTVNKKHAEVIEGLPSAAKFVLSIAVCVGNVLGPKCSISQAELKRLCTEYTQPGVFDALSTDDFLGVIEALKNNGLLLTGDSSSEAKSERTEKNFRLGIQLEDVECALQETLQQQDFFKRIVEKVKQTCA